MLFSGERGTWIGFGPTTSVFLGKGWWWLSAATVSSARHSQFQKWSETIPEPTSASTGRSTWPPLFTSTFKVSSGPERTSHVHSPGLKHKRPKKSWIQQEACWKGCLPRRNIKASLPGFLWEGTRWQSGLRSELRFSSPVRSLFCGALRFSVSHRGL